MIDSLCERAKEENLAVAWLYCDHKSEEQAVANMMGAILKQLETRETLKGMRKEYGRGTELDGLLRTAIASLRQVFICIDALDECPPENLPGLLELLGGIVHEFPRTRIFLTGRPHVKEVIQRHFVGAVEIPICPNPKDIRNYLRMRLERDGKPEAMGNNLRASIGEIIVEKMSDRWVGALGVSPLLVVCGCILTSDRV